MPEKQKEQLISQSGVLSMGFTKSMIDKLLPPPVLKRNPRYASAAPMKLWREEDVRSVMETQEFQKMSAKSAARKAAAAKAVETKRQNAELVTDELIKHISVRRWNMATLERKTLDEKELRNLEHGNYDVPTPDARTLERWMVNFIRHNLCDYDDNLDELFGLVGKEELYKKLKAETLAKIAEVYPELKEECKRQAQA